MKIEIKEEKGEIVGWDIIPETPEDEKTVWTMRCFIYYGVDDNAIVYAGTRGHSLNTKWPIDALKFRKKKYQFESIISCK